MQKTPKFTMQITSSKVNNFFKNWQNFLNVRETLVTFSYSMKDSLTDVYHETVFTKKSFGYK